MNDLIKATIQLLKIFHHHKENSALIFTHSEDSTFVERAEIETIFKDKYKIKYILFPKLNTDSNTLSDWLNKTKEEMNNIEETIIENRELISQVDPEYDCDCLDIREDFRKRFLEILNEFKEAFKNAEEKGLKRELFFGLKDYYKNQIVEEYKKIIQENKTDHADVVLEVIMFQNSIYKEFKEFKDLAELNLAIQTFTYNGEFNKYKECPKCGLIWFKSLRMRFNPMRKEIYRKR